MLFSKEQDYSLSYLSRKKGCRLTPIDITWQKAYADCLILTPEEDKERQKRIADTKERKNEITKLKEQIKKIDDEVKIILKELKHEFSSASIEKVHEEIVENH